MKINNINIYSQRFYTFKGSSSRKNADSSKISDDKADELKKRTADIRKIIKKAADEKRKISLKELVSQSGYTTKTVNRVLENNKSLNALWSQVTSSTRLTNAARAKKLEELKAILQEAKDNCVNMSLTELAQKTGLGRSAVSHYVSENEELNKLWYWVKAKSPIIYTDEEIQQQTEIIKEQLELAIEQKKAITRYELAEAAGGIDIGVVQNRINADETLTALREQTLAFEDESHRLEIAKIKKILKKAKESGLKITQTYISSTTGIPTTTVFTRIQQNPELSRLFESVRMYKHNQQSREETAEQDATIITVMKEIAAGGQKMTQNELASNIPSIESNIVISRLNNNPVITSLWQQIKKNNKGPYSPDEIAARTEKIAQILTRLKDEGKNTTLKELADMTGYNSATLHKYIKASATLDALWQAVRSQNNIVYTEEEIEVQNVMIERILRQGIEDKTKPTFYQMSQYLDLTHVYVKRLIEKNEKLLTLYRESQNI